MHPRESHPDDPRPSSSAAPAPAGPSAPAARPAAQGSAAHDERLWPGTAGWVAVLGFAAMLGIALWPVGTVWGVTGGVVGLIFGATVAVRSAMRVEVSGGELHAGAAHVPLALLREPRVLDAAATRHELGPGLDARAHLCLRGWVRTAVRVELDDPRDPTPYWVISTRRPEDLAHALGGPAPEQV